MGGSKREKVNELITKLLFLLVLLGITALALAYNEFWYDSF